MADSSPWHVLTGVLMVAVLLPDITVAETCSAIGTTFHAQVDADVMICGDRDLESPAGLAFPFHQRLIDGGVADARLFFVPGSGHSPHTEFPAAFARIVGENCGT